MYTVNINDFEPVLFTESEIKNAPLVGLIDETITANYDELVKIASVIQIQVHKHLKPYWNVTAVVKAYRSSNEAPAGTWLVKIRDSVKGDGLNEPKLLGVHQIDAKGVPFAIVKKWDNYTITLSHEIMEMLVNPKLNYFIKSTYNGKVVYYLNEVAGATQSNDFAYVINGIRVSDFYTKNYYDLVWLPNTKYSFTGAILRPKDILSGGYSSFLDDLGNWFQVFGLNGRERLVKLGETVGENPLIYLSLMLLLIIIIYLYSNRNE